MFWRSPSQGWNCFKSGNLINLLLTKSNETFVQYPILSDYSVESFPDLSMTEKNIVGAFNNYLGKIKGA